MRSAHLRNAPVRIPTAVLVELYRGPGFDEPVDRVVAQGFAQVITLSLHATLGARVRGGQTTGLPWGVTMVMVPSLWRVTV